MSFLLHAARKLELKREINYKTLQQTQINMQISKATQEVKDFQQYMSNMKNMTSVFTSNFAQAGQYQALAQAGLAGKNYGDLSVEEQQKYATAIQAGTQFGSQLGAMTQSVATSIFDATNSAKLKSLEANASRLELEADANKTQLDVLQAQYDAAVEGEKARIKDAAPGFGLA